jgi:hypothetical protein
LPYAEVWVGVHVPLPLLLTHFRAQVLHDRARFVVRGDAHNAAEFTVVPLLSR